MPSLPGHPTIECEQALQSGMARRESGKKEGRRERKAPQPPHYFLSATPCQFFSWPYQPRSDPPAGAFLQAPGLTRFHNKGNNLYNRRQNYPIRQHVRTVTDIRSTVMAGGKPPKSLIPPSWLCFDKFDQNSPKPWILFTRFDKISSNYQFSLLRAFRDITVVFQAYPPYISHAISIWRFNHTSSSVTRKLKTK